MYKLITFAIVFSVSYFGVKFFRRWSLKREFFDIPNDRSSHTTPTPRGGGLVIVLVCLFTYTIYTVFVSHSFQWSYLTGAALVAAVSWLDDIFDISFVIRFFIHATAAILVIISAGYFNQIYVPFASRIEFGISGAILTFCWIVWLTNAYNFMDGIDGIAGMQAVSAGIGWLLIGQLLGFEDVGFYGGVIALSSLGFLIHNWQPAKIFMGDVGSAFLGYTFAVLPLLPKNKDNDNLPLLPWIAFLLVFLFVSDTIFTFFYRIAKMEKIWQAHRSHVYQKLVIAGFSHRFVTTVYAVISFVIISGLILWIKTIN